MLMVSLCSAFGSVFVDLMSLRDIAVIVQVLCE